MPQEMLLRLMRDLHIIFGSTEKFIKKIKTIFFTEMAIQGGSDKDESAKQLFFIFKRDPLKVVLVESNCSFVNLFSCTI